MTIITLGEPAMQRTVADLQRVATDAVSTAPVLSMAWWRDYFHGAAEEVAFWCAILLAVGRVAWFLWDCWDRWSGKQKAARPVRVPDLGERAVGRVEGVLIGAAVAVAVTVAWSMVVLG